MKRADVKEQFTPGIPETAKTLSEDFDCHPDTVMNRAKELAVEGKIQTKKLGARARVYWIPAPDMTVNSSLIRDEMFRSGKDPGILRVMADYLNDNTRPVTSGEIAEQVDDSQDIIYNRLRKLDDKGWVESLKAGSTSKVWWLNKDKLETETKVTTGTTSLSLSEALKDHLRDVAGINKGSGVRGVETLHGALLYILKNPYDEQQTVEGYEETLTDPVKVSDETLERMKSLRNKTGSRDYEEAIRKGANIEKRDRGEEPIDVTDLDG